MAVAVGVAVSVAVAVATVAMALAVGFIGFSATIRTHQEITGLPYAGFLTNWPIQSIGCNVFFCHLLHFPQNLRTLITYV